MQAGFWNGGLSGLIVIVTLMLATAGVVRADDTGPWTIIAGNDHCEATNQVDPSGNPAAFNRLSVFHGPTPGEYAIEVAFWPGAVSSGLEHSLMIGNGKDLNLTLMATAVNDTALLTLAPVRFFDLRRFSESDELYARTPAVRQQLTFSTRGLRDTLDALQTCLRDLR